MTQQDKLRWIGSRRHAAGDDAGKASAAPLSEQDRHRLLREWTEANTLGDEDARRRVEDEILGRGSPQSTPKSETDTQNR